MGVALDVTVGVTTDVALVVMTGVMYIKTTVISSKLTQCNNNYNPTTKQQTL